MEFWSTLPYNLKFGEILEDGHFGEFFWLENILEMKFGGFGWRRKDLGAADWGSSADLARNARSGRICLSIRF